MICVKIFVGGKIEYNDDGVFYSTRPKYSLPITVNHSFDYLQNEIYKLVGYTISEANLEIQARFNMSTDGQRDYQLIPVTNQASFEMILGIVASFPQRVPVLELYVELEPNDAGFNSRLNLDSQALVPSQIPESRSRPSTSRNPEPITRSRPSTSRNPARVRRPVPVPDYSHVPVDAINDDSLESGDEQPSNESSDSDDDVEPTSRSRSHSRQTQYPITGRENMTHPVESMMDTSYFRPADVSYFASSNRTFDNPLAEGKVFESKSALRVAINEFHIRNNFESKVSRSEPGRLVVACKDDLCKFKLCAKPYGLSQSWIISKQPIPHGCKVPAQRADHCQLTAEMVALAIDETMRRDITVSINHIRDVIKATYKNVTPKYNKLWRGRELAIANLFGSWENSYNLLIPLFEAIKRSNPGTKYCVTSTPIDGEADRHFKAAAWAYGPCIAAIPFIRPVISIDACFMSGRYQGRLLMACGYDAENQLFPLAFGIVEKESAENRGFL
jgi:hypothetical protein